MQDKVTVKHELTFSAADKAALAAFLKANETWLTDTQAQNLADRCAQFCATQIPATVDID